MLDGAKYTLEGLDLDVISKAKEADLDVISKAKEAVYEMLIRHVAVEGYPSDTIRYTESNRPVHDILFSVLLGVLFGVLFERTGKRMLKFECKSGRPGPFTIPQESSVFVSVKGVARGECLHQPTHHGWGEIQGLELLARKQRTLHACLVGSFVIPSFHFLHLPYLVYCSLFYSIS